MPIGGQIVGVKMRIQSSLLNQLNEIRDIEQKRDRPKDRCEDISPSSRSIAAPTKKTTDLLLTTTLICYMYLQAAGRRRTMCWLQRPHVPFRPFNYYFVVYTVVHATLLTGRLNEAFRSMASGGATGGI